MDLVVVMLLLCFVILVFFYLLKPNSGNTASTKLPPGPKPYPIIGNILEIGQEPHVALAKLSKIYGPLMSLKLGSVTTVVVSSPQVSKLILQKHDQIFSGRTHPHSIRALDHHKFSVAWMPVDNKWRQLRRICKEKMFSATRLNASQGLRMKKLQNLRDYVCKSCANGQVVDIGDAAFATSLSLMSTILFSMDFGAIDSDSSHEFRDIVCGIMEIGGKPNLSDTFPILRVADDKIIICNSSFQHILERLLQNVLVWRWNGKDKD